MTPIARAAAFAFALCLSTPALASGGWECRAVAGKGPVLSIGIGHTIAARPFSVTLTDGNRTLATAQNDSGTMVLGQSWIDRRVLWLDLVDPQVSRFVAKLRATFQPSVRGKPATGTLEWNGRTYRVRCQEA
jgi:hypothetical protein